jgi:hypothetical protein
MHYVLKCIMKVATHWVTRGLSMHSMVIISASLTRVEGVPYSNNDEHMIPLVRQPLSQWMNVI